MNWEEERRQACTTPTSTSDCQVVIKRLVRIAEHFSSYSKIQRRCLIQTENHSTTTTQHKHNAHHDKLLPKCGALNTKACASPGKKRNGAKNFSLLSSYNAPWGCAFFTVFLGWLPTVPFCPQASAVRGRVLPLCQRQVSCFFESRSIMPLGDGPV